MQKIDRVLWEKELASHPTRHPDLQNLPPFESPLRARRSDLLLAIMIWLTVLGAGVAGWLIGLHYI